MSVNRKVTVPPGRSAAGGAPAGRPPVVGLLVGELGDGSFDAVTEPARVLAALVTHGSAEGDVRCRRCDAGPALAHHPPRSFEVDGDDGDSGADGDVGG